jgi:hypothetical protein
MKKLVDCLKKEKFYLILALTIFFTLQIFERKILYTTNERNFTNYKFNLNL